MFIKFISILKCYGKSGIISKSHNCLWQNIFMHSFVCRIQNFVRFLQHDTPVKTSSLNSKRTEFSKCISYFVVINMQTASQKFWCRTINQITSLYFVLLARIFARKYWTKLFVNSNNIYTTVSYIAVKCGNIYVIVFKTFQNKDKFKSFIKQQMRSK